MVTVTDQQVLAGDQFIAELRGRRRPRVFIISGPSGVGKDSVIDRLREIESDTYFAVTATTRPKRHGEVDGIHYFFLDHEQFANWVADGEFMEFATVYEQRYGVPKPPVRAALQRGQDVVIKIDVQGAATIRSLIPDSIGIFIAPESMDSLYLRLSARKSDDPAALARRFEEARIELLRAQEFDYIVFNETNGLLRAVDEISAIIRAVRAEIRQPEIAI
ncbi:MAG TPA: guanylate kinase [Thermomicrobiales bacterium]|jgi:guanylate kinase|nr:guanylate kinase [Thermomicrobiales bacterium]